MAESIPCPKTAKWFESYATAAGSLVNFSHVLPATTPARASVEGPMVHRVILALPEYMQAGPAPGYSGQRAGKTVAKGLPITARAP